jgi:transcriptional regulator GlxA family with amidase domain
MPTHVVAVLAFDRISAFHLSVPCVVFGEAHPGMPPFTLRVFSVDKSPLRTSSGFSLNVEHGLEAIAAARTVIVPSWRDPAETPPAELLAALVAAHRRGADIVGLCLGAYVLAEAGLLDGRRATTHWECAADFARRYPQVRLDHAVLYVEDGQLTTSAGTAAGIDCCLHLLRRDYGSRVANAVARRLVVSPHRQGGQAQFVEQPLPANTRDSRLGDLLDWVRASLDRPHTLDSLAAQALMSRRTFTRHFRQLTGNTVGAWLLGERLARSQQLLEAADHTVEQVAALAGFGSVASLRQHFRRAFGITPSAWRQGFRGN